MHDQPMQVLAAGALPTEALATVWDSARTSTLPAAVAAADVLRQADEEGLAIAYQPEGIRLKANWRFLLDHQTPIGANFSVTRRGDRFEAVGWADAAHYAVLSRRKQVSPGYRAEAARIERFGGFGIARVERATLMELSAVTEAARADTTLLVLPPEPVPRSEWHRVLWADGTTFDAPTVPEDRMKRFRAWSEGSEEQFQARLAAGALEATS